MEDADKIKKTIGRPEVKEIIDFIKENPGTTTQKVVDQLKYEKIPASRITTLSLIDKLVNDGIIKDDRIGSYSHKLRYNEDFDVYEFALGVLTLSLDEVETAISGLTEDYKVKQFIDEGKKMLNRLALKADELKESGLVRKTYRGKKRNK
jgi:hypothetical protein